MPQKSNISREQLIWLAFAAACGNIAFTAPYVAAITGRAFWLAVLVGVLLTIPLAVWLMVLGKFAPGGNLFDLLEQGVGKWLSWPLVILFCLINIATAVVILNLFTEAIRAFFLPFTPAGAIMLVILFLCALFVSNGFPTLGRLIEILAVLAIVTYFVGYSLAFVREFKAEYVIPVFDRSMAAFVKGVVVTLGTVCESLLFFMVMIKSVSRPEKQVFQVVKGLTVWAVILAAAIFIQAGVLGINMLSRVAHAGISIAALIQIGEFIRGVEVFVVITYQYVVFYKTSIYLFSLWAGVSQFFNGKQGKVQLIFITLVVFISSVAFNSLNQVYLWSFPLGIYVILPFAILVLMLASLAALLKLKKGGKTPNEKN